MENQSGGECNVPYMIRNAVPRPNSGKLWYMCIILYSNCVIMNTCVGKHM